MKKFVLLSTALAFFLLIPSVLAGTIFFDQFDRADASPPWSEFFPPCGSDYSITAGKYNLSTSQNCLAFAVVFFGQVAQNFTYQLEYTHRTGNLIIMEWADGTNAINIQFDTVAHKIGLRRTAFIFDFNSFSYPFPLDQSITYIFNGFTQNSVHNLTVKKEGTAVTVFVDGSSVVTFSHPNNNVSAVDIGIGVFRVAPYGGGYALFDNVRVESVFAKIIPELTVGAFPVLQNPPFIDKATVGRTVTVACTANVPVPLQLQYFTTNVSNPFTFVPSTVGIHQFPCTSQETETFASVTKTYLLNVTQEEVLPPPPPPPTGLPPNITQPAPFINATEFEQAGIAFLLPFFSPLFISLFILFASGAIIEVLARSGGVAFGMVMLFGSVGLTILGFLPLGLAIILVIISGFIVVYTLLKIIRGGG
jgi:hypothetical protein